MHNIELKTKRLTLRPIWLGDEKEIHEYAGDKSITMMFYLPNDTFEETCYFVKSNVEEWNSPDQLDFEFVIIYEGKIIGGCDADLSHSEDHSYATLGWIINKEYRNRGFASEAAETLLNFAFDNLNIDKVYAQCDVENSASFGVMKKIGMTCVNDKGTRTYPKTGKVSGEYTCLITKDEWKIKNMFFENAYFIIGTSYAGKSTMVKELAKKHNGIACEENYHDDYEGELEKEEFPCLTYTRDLEDWHDFIRRSPQEYKDWIDGVKKECEIIELRMLPEICNQGKKVFVDTNISIETLKKIAPFNHTLVMLSDPEIPIHRFFDRPDPEKQFLYRLIMEEPDPEKAMENYREGLKLICSQEAYDEMEKSGFNVIYRDENRTIEQTVSLAEKAFGL